MLGTSLALSPGNPILGAHGVTEWSPANTTTTFYHDVSVLSSLWQDTAGTVAVTSDGQSCARIDDISGNGYHFTCSGAASSYPIYHTNGSLHWLEFDGIDDFLKQALLLDATTHDYVCGGSFVSVSTNSIPLANDAILSHSGQWWSLVYGRSTNKVGTYLFDLSESKFVEFDHTINTPFVLYSRHADSRLYAAINGGPETSVPAVNIGYVIGEMNCCMNDTQFANAKFYCHALLNGSTFSAGDRVLLQNWASSRAGV